MNRGVLAPAWLALLTVALGGWPATAGAAKPGWQRHEAHFRVGAGMHVRAIHTPPAAVAAETSRSASTASAGHPVPPLVGFSPLVAVTTSDKRASDDFDFEHELEYGHDGLPLNPPASEKFVIGILDSGSVVDLVAEPFNATLGLTGDYLGSYTLPIGGTGGTVDAVITRPVGWFAAGLGAIDAAGRLDLNQVVGHSNESLLVSPELDCGTGERLTAMVGTSLLSFFNTVIRVDTPVTATVGGQSYLSPGVHMLSPQEPLPTYPRKIAMQYGGLSIATTAAFYAFLDPGTFEVDDPIIPTMLVMLPGSIPLGGGYFFATVGAIEGEPGPTNPLQNMRMIVDTGAQSSIITPAMVANLSLDLDHPDFTVDVCGIGGLQEDVPGFYVDYIKMNADGGALQFAQAPFIVLDIPSPDGGEFAGVLGMNFFWNRNVIFQPSLTLSSFLHLSDPIPWAYGDFDYDLDVDADDYATFQACTSGPQILQTRPECRHIDGDADGDIDQTDFGQFQVCLSGQDVPADPHCGT